MTIGPMPPAPLYTAPAKGCICPPTSEKTCERFDCGRKNIGVTLAGSANPKRTEDKRCSACLEPADLCSCGKPKG